MSRLWQGEPSVGDDIIKLVARRNSFFRRRTRRGANDVYAAVTFRQGPPHVFTISPVSKNRYIMSCAVISRRGFSCASVACAGTRTRERNPSPESRASAGWRARLVRCIVCEGGRGGTEIPSHLGAHDTSSPHLPPLHTSVTTLPRTMTLLIVSTASSGIEGKPNLVSLPHCAITPA